MSERNDALDAAMRGWASAINDIKFSAELCRAVEEQRDSLRAKVAALEAENGRLKEAVSGEELVLLLGNGGSREEMATASWCRHFYDSLVAARAKQPSPAQDKPERERINKGQCAAQVVDCDCIRCSPAQRKGATMTDIKSIPSMSKAELIKEVERLAALVRSQSAAMTELGKLSDMQQARIAALREALGGLLADVFEYQTMNNLGGWDNHAQVAARAALAATEPRP